VVGLVVAAVVCGSAAAAVPGFVLHIHARLKPVAGATAGGRFDGTLSMIDVGGMVPLQATPNDVPVGTQWRLNWRLSLPALKRPTSATLRLARVKGAPPAVRVLCSQCTATAHGTITLPQMQAFRVVRSDAVVVVRAQSARLRGTLKSLGATQLK
jgi:hypothetical protein